MTIVLTLLGISALIVLHELGHYLTARACGMSVSRFSVGFGPTLLQFKGWQTQWRICAIPIGGYVMIDGMGEKDDETATTDTPNQAGLFRDKPLWQRALVIAAGPAANWLVTAGLFTALALGPGLGQADLSQAILGQLQSGGPAAEAGLKPGDRIQRINGMVIVDWAHLVQTVRDSADSPLALDVVRGQQVLPMTLTPRNDSGLGMIDAAPKIEYVRYRGIAALQQGTGQALHATRQQASALASVFGSKKSGVKLSGLPGIIQTVSHQADQSLSRLFEALAFLSMGLCLLNLLPIPALDGGRLVFLAIEALSRRPVNEQVEGIVHTVGFVLLFAVMIFVSARDILRFF